MTVCGAKTRNGGHCQLTAGWGTQHPGNGRCKLHGGASPGAPIITGRYSLAHRKSLEEKARTFANDLQPGSLLSELALMRALLQEHLENNPDDTERQFGMMEAIGRMVERIVKIMSSTSLTQSDVRHLQDRFALALLTYVPDADTRIAILRSIFEDSGAVVSSDQPRLVAR